MLVTTAVRERYAFKCDIGTRVQDLSQAWPGHDFSAIDDVWWPSEDEPEAQVVARAARFREEMAADPEWRNTVVVSHWGFILALTGVKVGNGEWLRCDPTSPPPAEIAWRA